MSTTSPNRFEAEDARISKNGEILTVKDIEYPAIWLRDHCPQSINTDTKQREVDTAAVTQSKCDRTIRAVEISGDDCTISFDSGHKSIYSLQWLQDNIYRTEEYGETIEKIHTV